MTLHNTLLIVEGSELKQPLNIEDLKEILLPYRLLYRSNPPSYIIELWDDFWLFPILTSPNNYKLISVIPVKFFDKKDFRMQKNKIYNYIKNSHSSEGKIVFGSVIFYDDDTKTFDESILYKYDLNNVYKPLKTEDEHMKKTFELLEQGDANYCYSLKMRI